MRLMFHRYPFTSAYVFVVLLVIVVLAAAK